MEMEMEIVGKILMDSLGITENLLLYFSHCRYFWRPLFFLITKVLSFPVLITLPAGMILCNLFEEF